jgi:ribonuclease E
MQADGNANGNDNAAREPREGREGGRSRGGRGRRNDRGPRLDEAGNPIPTAQGQDEANGQASAEGGAREGADNRDSNGRRSRDRYGRERGQRNGPDTGTDNQEEQAQSNFQMRQPDRESEDGDVPVRSYFTQAVPAPLSTQEAAQDSHAQAAPSAAPAPVTAQADAVPHTAAQTNAVPHTAAQADAAPQAAAQSEATPQAAAPVAAPATPAPAVQAAPAMPAVSAFVLPIENLVEVAQSSGLRWVNSDPHKIAVVQAAIAAEPVPVHLPRERSAPVVLDDAPLVLVETKRDLGQMQLPIA